MEQWIFPEVEPGEEDKKEIVRAVVMLAPESMFNPSSAIRNGMEWNMELQIGCKSLSIAASLRKQAQNLCIAA